MTHFAEADGEQGVAWQMERFRAWPATGGPVSLGNSAAILRHPEDPWRLGARASCSTGPAVCQQSAAELGLQPAMTWKAPSSACGNWRPASRSVTAAPSRAERPMRISVVACGYADGYPAMRRPAHRSR